MFSLIPSVWKKRSLFEVGLVIILSLLWGQAGEAQAAGGAVWFQNFEQTHAGKVIVPAPENTEVKLVEATGEWQSADPSSRRLLLYAVNNSGSPEKEQGSVVIRSMHGPVDTRAQKYLIIWIKDMQGNNSMKVSLIDEAGRETAYNAAGWAKDTTRRGQWHPYYVWLDDLEGTVDRAKITGIRLGQWNCGTYAIDQIYFDDVYVTSQLPDTTLTTTPEASVPKAAVTASLQSGDYHGTQQVELFGAAGTELYYTLDGTTPVPGQSGTMPYSRFLIINRSATLQAVAVLGTERSEVVTFSYHILPYPVGADSPSGTYESFAIVELRNRDGDMIRDDGSHIYYTLDGTTPDSHKTRYSTPIKIQSSTILKALAYVPESQEVSDIASFAYTITPKAQPNVPTVTHDPKPTQSAFLQTDHQVIRNKGGTGDVVTLKGFNASGWLVMERWQCLTNARDQLVMQKTLTERFGADNARALLEVYEDNWWTEADFDRVKAEGANTIRLPITYLTMCNLDGSWQEGAFERLDWFVAECQKREIYMIIDLHGAVGSQNGEGHSGDSSHPAVGDFYGNEANIRATISLWEKIAARYKDNPWVAGYDLLNEPSASGATQFAVYDRLYRAIRAIDTQHMIFIQACWDPAQLPEPSFYGWENVVYEYHFYGSLYPNDVAYQRHFLDQKVTLLHQRNYDVPTLIGEFNFYDQPASWDYGLGVFDREGWSYTTWGYKAVPRDNSFGIYTADLPKVDIYRDAEAQILSKWGAGIQTQHFTRNKPIADILQKHFQGTAKPPKQELRKTIHR